MNKYFLSSFLLLASTILKAQGLYDINTIQTIEITFSEPNWDQLLDVAYANTGDYILAKSVAINGVVFDSVGVKYKGNSTYNANQKKNPFHIELDAYKDHEYQGYTDIKLSNVAKDPSFLREVLSYQILNKYMDSPLSNYANVYVNGALIGLYSSAESIGKKFVASHFYSKSNAFFKCNPPDGAGMGTTAYPNLVYLGEDSSTYYNAYELKSDAGWNELIDLCDTLSNHVSQIEKILDVDRALWMLAFDNVLVNLDSYIGAFAQNYYLYRDDNGRFVPIVWDLNESFGRFSSTGNGNLNSTISKQQMSHLLHVSDSKFPLVAKLLSVPMYKRMYLAHVKTMLLENFENNGYYTLGQSLQNLIAGSVQSDINKFFTYNNFIDNLTKDVSGGGGPGGESTPGITNLMDGRTTYLLDRTDFTNVEPTITQVKVSNNTPIINEIISITALVTNATNVFLGYRIKKESAFHRVQMYDDGFHQDGGANDGVFGVDIEFETELTQYYIYAENENIGKFSPERAEHEYHAIMASNSNPEVGDLVINELMASNGATITDQNGEYEDWIELYNNGSSIINLDSYFLSDDAGDLMKWQFPVGTSIAPKAFLTICADDDADQIGLHTTFKLSASGESLRIVDGSGTVIDEIDFANQTTDVSYGRFPNGIGSFQLMSPTFGKENVNTTSILQVAQSRFGLIATPNPAHQYFNIDVSDDVADEHIVTIYSMNGKEVYHGNLKKNMQIDASDWLTGVYIVRVGDTFLKLVMI